MRPTKQKKTAPKGKVAQAKEAIVEKVEAVKEAVVGKSNGDTGVTPAAVGGAPKAGGTIDLADFGGEIETHDGTKTTLAKLVEESKAGVVLFTYPKASTPGCMHPVHNALLSPPQADKYHKALSKHAFSAIPTNH